ncbi:13617_t:CDS:1, partial [Gigaspora rosea]
VQSKEFYAFSKQATNLHRALKKINKTISALTKRRPPLSITFIINKINKTIEEVNNLAKTNIQDIPHQDLTADNIRAILKLLLTKRKAIWNARNLENNNEQINKMNQYIEKRYSNFTSNTILMIDSILKWHRDPVVLDNIAKPDQLINSPSEIKKEIQDHFKNWTKKIEIDMEYWED